jgi:hypothetical protein
LTYKNAAQTSATNAEASENQALICKNQAQTAAGNAKASEAQTLTYKNAAQTSKFFELA